MPKTPAKTPGTIMGVKTKWAVVIVLVVFVGVWYYLKHRSTGVATQTQTTGQVAPTGQQDTTGGVAQSPDLSSLLDLFSQQNAAISDLSSSISQLGYNTPTSTPTSPATSNTTYNYTENYAGASPPVQQGAVNNPVSTSTGGGGGGGGGGGAVNIGTDAALTKMGQSIGLVPPVIPIAGRGGTNVAA